MGSHATTDTRRRRHAGAGHHRRRPALVARLFIAALFVAGCGGSGKRTDGPGGDIRSDVVASFERAVLDSRAAYLELFDFAAVGAFEKLLRRHDLLGRLPNLSEAARADLLRDTPEAYSVARERRNVGYFYASLAQPVIGTGTCKASIPVSAYGRKLGEQFPPLPAEHAAWDELRPPLNALLARGGVVAIRCAGGKGGLALVYTRTASKRGFDLITMYDDVVGY